jgi:hypothetical protein
MPKKNKNVMSKNEHFNLQTLSVITMKFIMDINLTHVIMVMH